MAVLSKKNVLVVAYYFPPLGGGGTLRTLKYVRYLPEFGWMPVVITVKDAHYLVTDEKLQEQVPENIKIFRTPALLPGRFFRRIFKHDHSAKANLPQSGSSISGKIFAHLKNWLYTFLFLPDEYIGWLPFAVKEALKQIRKNRISLIYTTAPPNSLHLIGWLVQKFTGVHWVADFRDLWDQYPDSYNPYKLCWKSKLDRFLEHHVLRAADKVIVVSDIMKAQLKEKFTDISPEKYEVITNGFDPRDFEDTFPVKKEASFCNILHTGTLFSWRRSTTFFKTVGEMLDTRPDFAQSVHLNLIGIVHSDVQQEIIQTGLKSNVKISPYQPYEQMIGALKAADFLLLIIGNQPKAANVLTLKLFDYIGAKKPILALAPPGEVSHIITKYHLGLIATPENTKEIRDMLEKAFDCWRTKTPLVLNLGFEEAAARFDRKYLTGKLAETFERLDES